MSEPSAPHSGDGDTITVLLPKRYRIPVSGQLVAGRRGKRRQRKKVVKALDTPTQALKSLRDEVLVNAASEEDVVAFRVELLIYGRPVKALVDSGATRTFIGPDLVEFLSDLGIITVQIPPRPVVVANSQIETVNTASEVPALLNNRPTVAFAHHLPALSEDLILGLDFLRQARMVVDFYAETWYFRDRPEEQFSFVPEIGVASISMCCGLRTPDTDEAKRLGEFLDAHLPPESEESAVTSLVTHSIEVANSPPVKQRPYTVTPVIRDIMWS